MAFFEISCRAGAFECLVYSLRHFYAVNALRRGVGAARNMDAAVIRFLKELD